MAISAGRFWRTAHGVCLLLFLLFLPGCGGCRKTPDVQDQADQEKQQAEEKAKKKEKEAFQARSPAVMPAGGSFAGSCKPGHWISQVWPEVRDNRDDFQGELQTQVIDRDDRAAPLFATPYEMANRRPAALAKEQPKSLESCAWIPPRRDACSVNFKLAAGGGPVAIERSMPLSPMPSYRYYFVVVSQAASRYDYLDKKLASIRWHRAKADADTGPKYYEVVPMPASRRPSLPSDALYWTSIAYLLWDDCDASQWDVDQQRALIDWLHWGGQIIVSGPEALEQLRNGFLRPYLPATVEKSRSLSANDLAELSYWAGEVGLPPRPVRPWAGGELKKDPHAEYLPYTGDLVVERRVGRGRIVASAFRLTGPELTGWAGFDCFFNACLLRRPARLLPAQDSENVTIHWAGRNTAAPWLDAARMTAVRYFSRDTGVEFSKYAADVVAAEKMAAESGISPDSLIDEGGNQVDGAEGTSVPAYRDPFVPGREVGPGLGAWNDFSPVAQAARTALEDAAGIKVPKPSFIVWMVAGYLCVLVPVNWLVFRLLGRVEWAWIAAPLIAIGCTVLVIQQAQLNIGFARSRNEIAVIEMQPGYSRAHVARYTVLYSSLATGYEFRLAGPAAQILPFPRVSEPEKFKMSTWQSRGELTCQRGDDTRLTGFNVGSNVIDYVHSEEMTDFGGTVVLRQDSDGTMWVTNGTSHPLDDCQVIRGNSAIADLAIIGRLEPGATTILNFKSLREKAAAKRPHHAEPSGELSVEGIVDVALKGQELRPGEICLVAQVEGLESGLTVTPATPQTRLASLLVAHLKPGSLPVPEADTKEKPAPPQAGTFNSILPSPAPDALNPLPADPGLPAIDLTPQPKNVP